MPHSIPKKAASMAFVLGIALAPTGAYAQKAAAPAMFGVEDIIVQNTHFGNDKVAQSCGLTQDEVTTALLKTLHESGVPVESVLDAKPPTIGRARINLVPDIFSLNSQGLDCTSWVSLTAETHNSVHVPPVDVARNIAVVYWHEGSLLSSSQALHDRTVIETVQKLASHLAEQYKLDQPQTSTDEDK